MIRLTPLRFPTRHVLHSLLLLGVVMAAANSRADELSDVQRLAASGQTEIALQKADQFLAGKPKDAPMRFEKGVILTDSKRSAEAIDVFRRLAEDYPELAEPYNNLATLYAATGDYDGARTELEHALRANPNYGVAHENLGDVYAMLASRSYARAQALEPSNASVAPKLKLLRELLAQRQQLTSGVLPK